MDYKNIVLEKEGNVALVKLNRPKALNALNTETLKEIDCVIQEISGDKEKQHL